MQNLTQESLVSNPGENLTHATAPRTLAEAVFGVAPRTEVPGGPPLIEVLESMKADAIAAVAKALSDPRSTMPGIVALRKLAPAALERHAADARRRGDVGEVSRIKALAKSWRLAPRTSTPRLPGIARTRAPRRIARRAEAHVSAGDDDGAAEPPSSRFRERIGASCAGSAS